MIQNAAEQSLLNSLKLDPGDILPTYVGSVNLKVCTGVYIFVYGIFSDNALNVYIKKRSNIFDV